MAATNYERVGRAKNTSLAGLVQGGFLESRADKVRLLDRAEYPAGWDPATDSRLAASTLATAPVQEML